MKLFYDMTAREDYRNGAIAWPQGMSGFWPKGELRRLPPPVFEQVQRDGIGQFDYQMVVVPEAGEAPPPVTIDRADGVQAEEASAAGETLAQYRAEQAAAPSAKEKRLAALEKARAAKAAKKAEQSAGE